MSAYASVALLDPITKLPNGKVMVLPAGLYNKIVKQAEDAKSSDFGKPNRPIIISRTEDGGYDIKVQD